MAGWDQTTPTAIDVLHVDDEEPVLELTRRSLQRVDDRFDVHVAVGAEAGLEVLEEQSIDCVISDYKMPEMNGLEFLERVRGQHPNLPFVLFTGEGSETVASEAIAAGATDYVPKHARSDRYEVLANRVSNAVESYRAEEAFRRSAERFRGLAEAAPVPIGVIDADGVLQYANEAGVEFFEADSAEHVVGERATDLVHPEDRARAGERVQRVVEQGVTPPAVETRFQTVDGETKVGLVTSAPIEFRGERAAQVVVNDVTAERRAESELEQQEAFTGSLLDALDGLFFVFELDEGLIRWNDRLETVTGYDPAELEGMTPEAFIPDAYADRHSEAVSRLQSGERARYDAAIRTKDGESVPYEFTVTSYETEDGSYQVGIGQNIESRVTRERRLRERKEQLETIVDNFPVVLFVVDEDGVFRRSTGAGLSRIGLEPGEVEGQTIHEVYGDRTDIISDFQRALSGEAVNATVEVLDRTFETWYQPVRDDDGVRQVVGAAFDVTDRVAHREELEEKNARLEQFASVVSHDLRNPLGVARGAFEFVAEYVESTPSSTVESTTSQPVESTTASSDGGEDSSAVDARSGDARSNDASSCEDRRAPVLEQVETVRSAHDRMDRIIDDVLALARGDVDVDERPVNGRQVVEEAVGNVKTDGATVEVAYDEIILADRGSLTRLVENLIRNAVEHGGERIRVGGFDAADPAGDGDPAVDDGDTEFGFYVADDGPGIDPAAREHVMEAGVSADDNGIGLGLAIVRDIADAHGWTITIDDDPDLGGARIEIRNVTGA